MDPNPSCRDGIRSVLVRWRTGSGVIDGSGFMSANSIRPVCVCVCVCVCVLIKRLLNGVGRVACLCLCVCVCVCRSVSYLCWAGLSLHLMESCSVSALPKISPKTHKLILDSSDNASDQILPASLQKSEGWSALSTAALHQLKRLNRL